MKSLTEFIMRHLFMYIKMGASREMGASRVRFLQLLTSLNKKEVEILHRVLKLCDEVYGNYFFFDILNLHTSMLLVEEEKLEMLLLDIHNQIFSTSVSWYRILLFFNIAMRFEPTLVQRKNFRIYEILSEIVKEKLQPWIDERNYESIRNDEPVFFFPTIHIYHIVPPRKDMIIYKCTKRGYVSKKYKAKREEIKNTVRGRKRKGTKKKL